jgi:hypothetical protein
MPLTKDHELTVCDAGGIIGMPNDTGGLAATRRHSSIMLYWRFDHCANIEPFLRKVEWGRNGFDVDLEA